MIRYDLVCAKGHEFDAWFAGSAAYDIQAEAGEVMCPVCGSAEVSKAPMAPAIARGAARAAHDGARGDGGDALRAARELAEVMAKVRRYVEQNAEYVGDRFAEEARAIHNKEAEIRQIYGEATLEEARELIEEGIAVAPLPAPRKKRH